MADTHARVDENKHEKFKAIAKRKKKSLKEIYDSAMDLYIKVDSNEEILLDSRLEQFLNEKFSNLDKHLSSMMGRTGMDTSMVLMGLILFLEKYFGGQITREQIQELLRKDGARYFSTAIQKDKELKKKDNQEI